MSEERRISAPAASPEDLSGDDDVTLPPPPVQAKPDASQRRGSDNATAARRVRTRMTLRIPDDEVARPTPKAMSAVDAPESPPQEIKGTRIISVGPPPPDAPAADNERTAPTPPAVPAELRARSRIHPEREDSWTPYQPTAVDDVRSPSKAFDLEATAEYPAPISEEIPLSEDAPPASSAEALDLDDEDAWSTEPPPPPRADVPPARAPMRALVPTDTDGEEIRFDEEDSLAPRSDPKPGRVSEPGDAPEVSADDLVSVESLPRAPPPAPAAPPMRPKAKSIPPSPPSNPPPTSLGAAASAPSPPTGSNAPTPPPSPPSPVSAQGPASPRLMMPPSSGIAPPAMTEAALSRKRTRPWWEELFNDDFIRATAKITDAQIAGEVTFIEESLGIARDGVLLDLACGTGLHAIELTRRGYHVVGFDLSLAMLARAADEAQDRNQTLNFVQGDMREMTFEEAFDGVYSWGTSFGYFDEEKNAQIISRVHKSLKPGGVFLLDVVNRDYIIRQSPSLAWFEGEGCICMDEMQIDFITSRMKVKRTMMLDDGRTKEVEYSIRVYALHELGRILHEQGFRVAEVSGRTATPGVFFGCEAPRTLILAEKR